MEIPKTDNDEADLEGTLSVGLKKTAFFQSYPNARRRSNFEAISDEVSCRGPEAWVVFRERLEIARADNHRILAIDAEIGDAELARVQIFSKNNFTPVGDWRYRADAFPDSFELDPEIHARVKIHNPISKWILRFAIREAQLNIERMRLF